MRQVATAFAALLGVIFVSCALAQPSPSKPPKPIRVLIITGDHGHAWRETTPFLKELLTKAGHQVDVTEKPGKDLTPENLAKYDVLILNYRNTPQGAKQNPDSVWSEANKQAFADAVRNGKGLVVYHHASAAFVGDTEWDREFEKIIAGGWRRQGYHGKMHEFVVTIRKDHPITRGIKEFKHGRDELYQNSVIPPGAEILATAYSDKSKDPKNTGLHEPMIWISHYGKGRVYHNVLGHDVEAMKSSAGFQILFIRGVEWAATGETYYPAPLQPGSGQE